MTKNIVLMAISIILITGCSPKITKEAAQVAFHSQISQLLDGCDRLGPVKVEYTTKLEFNGIENEQQMKSNMRQIAYDNYGADNVVFINSQRVDNGFGERDIIYGQGVAFKCD